MLGGRLFHIWRDAQPRRRQTNFLRKAGQSMVLNKLLKKLRNASTGGQAVADRAVPALKKMLSFFFRSSRSLPLTLFCRLSGEITENTFFVHKENKVSGILRELLKQKLSALHASSAVGVCQILCTAPLETFQMQVLTNNLRHRRPMNTHLQWFSWTVLWVCGLSSWLRTKSLTVLTFSSVRAQIDDKSK